MASLAVLAPFAALPKSTENPGAMAIDPANGERPAWQFSSRWVAVLPPNRKSVAAPFSAWDGNAEKPKALAQLLTGQWH